VHPYELQQQIVVQVRTGQLLLQHRLCSSIEVPSAAMADRPKSFPWDGAQAHRT
jgi:hypothetical protein